MSCQSQLCWYDLIPLISFFVLVGRCRSCKSKISIAYPLVELITGIIFAGLFLKFRDVFFADTFIFAVTYAYYSTVFSLLVVIAAYDLKHKIIPDVLAFIFGLLTFCGLFLFGAYGFFPHLPSLLEFLSGLMVALPFVALWLVSNGAWMGLGDGKLALGLGWLLGTSRVLSGVVIAFWSGAIIGIVLILFSKKHQMKSEIPFAPFLVFGTILAFLFELHLFPVF